MKALARIILIITLALTFACTTSVFARVYNGTPYSMRQPNGDSVTVLLYGSDLYIDAESIDHYTLTTDETTSQICYALISSDGREYASTGIPYQGGEVPEAVKMIVNPQIRISKESREEKIKNTGKKLNKEEYLDTPVLRAAQALPDTIYGLCLVFEFPDKKTKVTREQMYQFLNGDNNPQFKNKRSIKEYFQWISGGKLTYINFLPSHYFTTEQNMTYYAPLDATDYTIDKFYPMVSQAIEQWVKEDAGDLTKLSKNAYGGIKALNLLYAGPCENKWATGLWPHQSAVTLQSLKNANGRTVFQRGVYHTYQISDINEEMTMGTFVHENGHLVCGWPDFYQYEEHEANNAQKYNIGDAFSISSEYDPPYPNPWVLDQMGWMTDLIDITGKNGGEIITLTQGCGHAAIYRGTGRNSNEMYYLEIRDKEWSSWNNGHKGIFIWHVNEEGDNCYPNKPELLDCRPCKNNNPFWFKNSGSSFFSDDSEPSAKWYDGNNSGIYLCDFSEYGKTMTFRCGEKVSVPTFVSKELKPARLDAEYTDTIHFLVGTDKYNLKLKEGDNLPQGISISQDGVLTGTPVDTGSTRFTIIITDLNNVSQEQEFTFNVVYATPYTEHGFPIPGSFQMEEYDRGGNNIAYHSTRTTQTNNLTEARDDNQFFPMFRFINRSTNQTIGFAIEFNSVDEWTQYSVQIDKTNFYDMTLRNSTTKDAILSIFIDNELLDTMKIDGVRGINIDSNSKGYKYTTKKLQLPKGDHKLKFGILDISSTLRIDSVNFIGNDLVQLTSNKATPLFVHNTENGFSILGIQGNEIISIFNSQGILIEQRRADTDNMSFGEEYPQGIYLIKIISENSCVTLKTIKE